MNVEEYSAQDATALAKMVAAGEVTADELAILATNGINAVNEKINAVATGRSTHRWTTHGTAGSPVCRS